MSRTRPKEMQAQCLKVTGSDPGLCPTHTFFGGQVVANSVQLMHSLGPILMYGWPDLLHRSTSGTSTCSRTQWEELHGRRRS
jgi:hypothetical protein